MLDGLRECYRILDVEPGASLEEVKRSYRELVKVWHPDRFANDPSLQAKAQEKLKQINLAYERVCEAAGSESHLRTAPAEPPRSEAKATAAPAGSNGLSGFGNEPRSEAPTSSQPSQSAGAHQPSVFLRVAGVICIAVLARAVWFANLQQTQLPTNAPAPYSEPSSANQPAQPLVVQQQPEAKARQRLSIEQIFEVHQEVLKRQPELAKLGMTIRDLSIYFQTNQTTYDLSEGIAYSPPLIGAQPETVPLRAAATPVVIPTAILDKSAPPVDETSAPTKPTVESKKKVEVALAKARDSVSPAPSSPRPDFFTVGSTKDEVLAVQGTPTSISEQMLWYGSSSIQFQNGKVASWSDNYPKLKAKLLPATQVEVKDFFTVGSTKDEVLATQGTPSNFSDQMFWYGSSSVQFRNGKVAAWTENYPKLKAKLLPTSQVEAKSFFTVGSTKDEVLATQGTPSNFSDQMFWYGSSSVQFRNGKVAAWTENYPKLKAKLLPTSQVETKGFFTVGSTKDEVLAVQGTPSSFSEQMYWYGSSSVQFRNGTVVSWSDNYPKLKARLNPVARE